VLFHAPDFTFTLMDKEISNEGKWAEALRPGTFTDFSGTPRTFTPADISMIADGIKSQIAAGYMPPLVKGHPRTDSPRKASIVDAKIGDRNMLMVKLDKVEPKFAEEVKNGEYPYVSVALHKDYSKGIKHLGALGGIAPAVKGLQPLEFGENSDDVIYFAVSLGSDVQYAFRTLGRLFRRLREKLIEKESVEEADNIYPEWDIKTFEDFETPTEEDGDAAALAEGNAGSESDADKEKEALKAEIEALKAEKAKAEAEARKNAFAEKLNALAKEGKLRASQREHAEKIFELIGDGSLSFAEGDAKAAEESLLKIIESIEPAVKPGEHQFADGSAEPGDVDEARKGIRELVGKGMSYREALDEVTKKGGQA